MSAGCISPCCCAESPGVLEPFLNECNQAFSRFSQKWKSTRTGERFTGANVAAAGSTRGGPERCRSPVELQLQEALCLGPLVLLRSVSVGRARPPVFPACREGSVPSAAFQHWLRRKFERFCRLLRLLQGLGLGAGSLLLPLLPLVLLGGCGAGPRGSSRLLTQLWASRSQRRSETTCSARWPCRGAVERLTLLLILAGISEG